MSGAHFGSSEHSPEVEREKEHFGWTPRLLIQERGEYYSSTWRYWRDRRWWHRAKALGEFLLEFLLIFLSIAFFLGGLFGLIATAARADCINKAEVLKTDYEWRLFGGCFVEVDDRLIPIDNYRIQEDI